MCQELLGKKIQKSLFATHVQLKWTTVLLCLVQMKIYVPLVEGLIISLQLEELEIR